jgi:hypothetical protein
MPIEMRIDAFFFFSLLPYLIWKNEITEEYAMGEKGCKGWWYAYYWLENE